jgi:hypothetical protein
VSSIPGSPFADVTIAGRRLALDGPEVAVEVQGFLVGPA